MELHQINGKEISNRNDNLDEYDLQRRELTRLLRSAESEDKRNSLTASLALLESKKHQFQQEQNSFQNNSVNSSTILTSSPPSTSVGLSGSNPHTQRGGSARRQPVASLRSLNSDDELSSDGEGDEPLGYFSSPYKITNNRSPGSSMSSGGSLGGSVVDAPGSVPKINLSGASLKSFDNPVVSSMANSGLATLSPDLADAPLSGRKSVPTSARPASARWKGTLELRTIPEFAPFNRPLSGAKKEPAATSPNAAESKNDSGGRNNSNSLNSNSSSSHQHHHNHLSNNPKESKRIVVLDADEDETKQQNTPSSSSSSSSSSSNLNSSAFMPYSSTPKCPPSSVATSYINSANQKLGARCSPILELSLNIDIEDVWGSCVDPLRPPSALLIVNTSSSSSKSSLSIDEEKQNMRWSPSPRNRKFVNSPPPSLTLNNHRQNNIITPVSSSSSSSSSTSALSSPSCSNSVWITTGGFPQKLRIRLRRLATVHRVQLVCSGNPQLNVIFEQINPTQSNTAANYTTPTNRLLLPRMEAIDIMSSGDDAGFTSTAMYHTLPSMLYVLDVNANPKNDITALELEFVGATEPFCIISHLRIWGQVES